MNHDWRVPWHSRPHVVILGAGTSLAACPEGDASGKKLPLMNNLADVCQLRTILADAGIGWNGEDFERLYGQLAADPKHEAAICQIEVAIRDYFNSLSLPDEPTLYDRLVLSLREKDLIATFNWDPFLVQALKRNAHYAKSPRVAFLHGNVSVGYCGAHEPVWHGPLGSRCRTCYKPLTPVQLLYPVQQKDYTNNQYINASWNKLKLFLKHAYILTIFGYSAPNSDVEALALLKDGWGETGERYFEEIEVIDIREYETLHATWSPFICSGHWKAWQSFDQSLLAQWPRRSCEALHAQQIEGQWIDAEPMPSDNQWSSLRDWVIPRASMEREVES